MHLDNEVMGVPEVVVAESSPSPDPNADLPESCSRYWAMKHEEQQELEHRQYLGSLGNSKPAPIVQGYDSEDDNVITPTELEESDGNDAGAVCPGKSGDSQLHSCPTGSADAAPAPSIPLEATADVIPPPSTPLEASADVPPDPSAHVEATAA